MLIYLLIARAPRPNKFRAAGEMAKSTPIKQILQRPVPPPADLVDDGDMADMGADAVEYETVPAPARRAPAAGRHRPKRPVVEMYESDSDTSGGGGGGARDAWGAGGVKLRTLTGVITSPTFLQTVALVVVTFLLVTSDAFKNALFDRVLILNRVPYAESLVPATIAGLFIAIVRSSDW